MVSEIMGINTAGVYCSCLHLARTEERVCGKSDVDRCTAILSTEKTGIPREIRYHCI